MHTPSLWRPALALSVVAALCLPAYAGADEPAADPAAAVTVIDGCLASVPEPGSPDPVQICYSLHRPEGASPQAPVPMLLTSHGWGGTRNTKAGAYTAWHRQGFGVLSFDQRGFGESGGLAHVQSPDFEGQDVRRIVDLVADLDWVAKDGPGDPVLGAFGGSYGGGFQYVGAFTELRDTGRTRFDALAPSNTWWDLKESLAPEEVARTVWLTGLYNNGREDVPDEFASGIAYLTATGNWPGTGDFPAADFDAFFQKNGPAWHVSQGRRLDIPVMFTQGHNDNLFNLNQGLKSFDNALTPSARGQSMLVGVNAGHNLALPDAVPPGYETTGGPSPCNDRLGGGNLVLRFMQEKLQGKRTGLTGYGQYHLATADGACLTLDSVTSNTDVALGSLPVSTGAGAPVAHKLLEGPVTVAGQPLVQAAVTSAGVENRAFFALSIGTSPADAKVVSGNVMPLNQQLPALRAQRSFELPAVAIDVPKGTSLFLTTSPVSDQSPAHGSRVPGAMLLENTVVKLPVTTEMSTLPGPGPGTDPGEPPAPGQMDAGTVAAGGEFKDPSGIALLVSASIEDGVGTLAFRGPARSPSPNPPLQVVATQILSFVVQGSQATVEAVCLDTKTRLSGACTAVFDDGTPDAVILTFAGKTYSGAALDQASVTVIKG